MILKLLQPIHRLVKFLLVMQRLLKITPLVKGVWDIDFTGDTSLHGPSQCFLFKAAFVKPKGRSFQVVLVIVVTPRTSGPPNRPSKTICFISLCFALTFSPGSCPVSTALCCWILSTSRRVECLAQRQHTSFKHTNTHTFPLAWFSQLFLASPSQQFTSDVSINHIHILAESPFLLLAPVFQEELCIHCHVLHGDRPVCVTGVFTWRL